MKRFIFSALAFISLCGASFAQVVNPGVQQFGSVTVNDCAKWGPGVGQIQSAGAPCGSGGGGGVTSFNARTGAVTPLAGDYSVGDVTGAAPLASPAFTGAASFAGSAAFTNSPTGPTPTTADSTTKLATTAFVKAQNYLTGNQSVTLSGDCAGTGATAISVTCAKVNGVPFNPAGAATNDVLTYNGTAFVPSAFASLMNAACGISPSACAALFGYTNTSWYGLACNGTTDDTVKLQAAITGTPQGGTLYIQPSAFNQGCLIKTTTTVGAVTYNVIVNKPMSIKGAGRYSWIKTDASIATNVVNIYLPVSGVPWDGSEFSGFQLSLNGNPSGRPYTRAGGMGMYFDATTGGASGFSNLNIHNIMIGESGNNFSFILDGVSSTLNTIRDSVIWGGAAFYRVADSNNLINNQLAGVGSFGTLMDCSAGAAIAAGQCMLMHNNITNAGGLQIDGGSWVGIYYNYFEEIGTVAFPRGAFIDLRASSIAVNGTQIIGNIIANIVSTTSLGILIGTNGGGNAVANTYIGNNFIANLNSRIAVSNFGTGTATYCAGLNTWQTSTTHVQGTGTLKNAIGTVVTDCP